MTRIYVPTTLAELGDFYAAGEVPASADRFVASLDDEESEYLALMTAADASRAAGTDRRVVLVAEVPDEDAPAPLRTWVALHADAASGAADDEEPGWFGIQEIPDLLGP